MRLGDHRRADVRAIVLGAVGSLLAAAVIAMAGLVWNIAGHLARATVGAWAHRALPVEAVTMVLVLTASILMEGFPEGHPARQRVTFRGRSAFDFAQGFLAVAMLMTVIVGEVA